MGKYFHVVVSTEDGYSIRSVGPFADGKTEIYNASAIAEDIGESNPVYVPGFDYCNENRVAVGDKHVRPNDINFAIGDFRHCDCSGIDFTSNVEKSVIGNFDNTDLREANLSGLDLTGVKIWRYANIQGAIFNGADLAGCDLSGAEGEPQINAETRIDGSRVPIGSKVFIAEILRRRGWDKKQVKLVEELGVYEFLRLAEEGGKIYKINESLWTDGIRMQGWVPHTMFTYMKEDFFEILQPYVGIKWVSGIDTHNFPLYDGENEGIRKLM